MALPPRSRHDWTLTHDGSSQLLLRDFLEARSPEDAAIGSRCVAIAFYMDTFGQEAFRTSPNGCTATKHVHMITIPDRMMVLAVRAARRGCEAPNDFASGGSGSLARLCRVSAPQLYECGEAPRGGGESRCGCTGPGTIITVEPERSSPASEGVRGLAGRCSHHLRQGVSIRQRVHDSVRRLTASVEQSGKERP